jgi:hypothetical protein
MDQILQYLKKHGEKLDAEIAEGAGLLSVSIIDLNARRLECPLRVAEV